MVRRQHLEVFGLQCDTVYTRKRAGDRPAAAGKPQREEVTASGVIGSFAQVEDVAGLAFERGQKAGSARRVDVADPGSCPRQVLVVGLFNIADVAAIQTARALV